MGVTNLEMHGGLVPYLRHAARIMCNRAWSIIVKRGLKRVGSSFNIDFTSRIIGGKHIEIGANFHGTRGLKIIALAEGGQSAEIKFGNRVCLNEFVTIVSYDKIVIGDNVLIGSRVYLGTVNHGAYSGPDGSEPNTPPNDRPLLGSGALVIGANVWIGEGVLIPGGITIGAGSVIGAGAVVTRDIPANCVAVGNPARVVKCFDDQTKLWRKAERQVHATA